MVLQDLYISKSVIKTDNQLEAIVEINAKHQIFDGHFPQQPVTPGVVQIQIVREILESHYKKSLNLIQMGRCKFLNVWDPNIDPVITIEITISEEEYEGIKMNTIGKKKDKNFFKFNALFK